MPKRVLNISESSSIALHAARALARAESPMTSAEIAEESGVSRHHLSKVLRKMVEAGIVSALKGPNGGFYFTEDQKKNSFNAHNGGDRLRHSKLRLHV